MLIEMPAEYRRPDPIFAMIASINGNEPQTSEERVGIYRIGHFGSSDFMRGWESYPEFDPIPVRDDMSAKMKEDAWDGTVGRNAYGVCDSLEQLLAHFPELEAPGREFVVTLTEVRKADQPSSGGWRWHKWGPYIGTFDHQYEYLYDEKGIESVLIFHIYERINYDALTTEQLKERHKAKFYREFDATSSHWIGDSDGEQRVGLLRAFRKGW